ncbi:MAG: hypothetical protein ABMB14_29505, partial [Myxococcota bacterium]
TGTTGDTGAPYEPRPLVLTDTVVTGNSADTGGGILSWIALEVTGGEISDNVAVTSGGGLRAVNDPVTLTGVSVLRNTAALGGGIALATDATVGSVSSDWGTGADDNAPEDVWTGEVAVSGYGADATFDCAADGCAPSP